MDTNLENNADLSGIEKAERPQTIKGKLDSVVAAQTEMNAKGKRNGIIFLAVAIILLIGSAIGFILTDENSVLDEGLFICIFIFACLGLFFSVIILSVVKTNMKNAQKKERRSVEYEVFSDCIVFSVRDGDLSMCKERVIYCEVAKSMETEHYLFIYTGGANAYPITKAEHSQVEYDTILKLLSKPPKYSGITIELDKSGAEL